MGSPSSPNASIHAPHTLLPVALHRNEYHSVSSISLIFHKVIDALSRDVPFLISCIGPTADSDPDFTGKMVSLLKRQITENGHSQHYQLGIFRSDYMKNESTSKWGQIEFNTIAASFGALSDLTTRCHRFIMTRFLDIDSVQKIQTKGTVTEDVAAALGTAAKLVHSLQPIVLMVVQGKERNLSDQRRIEYALWTQHRVKVIR